MGWAAREANGGRIEGTIGDPLGIHVTMPFAAAIDFTGHTWLCQIRKTVPSPLVATLELVADNTTVTPPVDDDDPGSALIDLTFALANTSVFEDCIEYVYGVKATDGPNAPFTVVRAAPILGRDGTARPE